MLLVVAPQLRLALEQGGDQLLVLHFHTRPSAVTQTLDGNTGTDGLSTHGDLPRRTGVLHARAPPRTAGRTPAPRRRRRPPRPPPGAARRGAPPMPPRGWCVAKGRTIEPGSEDAPDRPSPHRRRGRVPAGSCAASASGASASRARAAAARRPRRRRRAPRRPRACGRRAPRTRVWPGAAPATTASASSVGTVARGSPPANASPFAQPEPDAEPGERARPDRDRQPLDVADAEARRAASTRSIRRRQRRHVRARRRLDVLGQDDARPAPRRRRRSRSRCRARGRSGAQPCTSRWMSL